MSERSNPEWIACLSGADVDPQAVQDLLAALTKAALFYLRRHLGTGPALGGDGMYALADDMAQDASLLVLSKLGTFRGEARFLTWASSFAVRLTRTALQRRAWRDISLDSTPEGWAGPIAALASKDAWANPQAAIQRQAMWEVIEEVVRSDLTDYQRRVLDLVVIKGVSTEQVEEMLNVTASALYKTTHDARRKLKAGLLKRGFSTDEILDAFAVKG